MSAVREKEAGVEPPKIRPELIMLLEFFEKEIVQKRILPLEERIKRIEDRLDYTLSQMVSEITKNALSAAYQLSSDEMRSMMVKEMEEVLAKGFSNLAKIFENIVRGLEETVKRIESVPEVMERKIVEIDKKIMELGPKIDVEALAAKIKPTIDEALATDINRRLRSSVEEIEPRVIQLCKKVDAAQEALVKLNNSICNLVESLEHMQAWMRDVVHGREEEVEEGQDEYTG